MRSPRARKRSASQVLAPAADVGHVVLAALTALLTATPLIPSEAVAESGAGLFLIVLWLLLLVAWVGMGIARGGLTLRADGTLAAVAGFAVLVALSGWMTAADGNPRATINSAWQWIAFAVAFFLTRQMVTTSADLRAICAVMIGLAVALAVLGYFQYFISLPQTRAEFARDPQQAYRAAGLGTNPDPQMAELFRNRIASVEPIATFALTNSLAGFLAPWLIVAAGVGCALWRNRPPSWPRALVGAGLAFALIGGCFVLTKSRTAWVAVALGGMALLVGGYGWRGAAKLDWRIPAAAGALCLGLVIGAVFVGGVDVEVLSEAPKSLLYRLEYWQATAAMIRDHPLWGVGVGNFQTYYTAYKLPQASETIADPHNFLLEIWATAGLFSLLAFAGAFGLLLGSSRNRRNLESSPAAHQLAKGVQAQDELRLLTRIYAVYVGAFLGMLLGVPLTVAAGFTLDPVLLGGGVPVGAACVALLHPWTRGGMLPRSLPAIALAVLFVNLLAAGGIGFASVATSLWLLAAMAANIGQGERLPLMLNRRMSWGVALGIVLLVLAFYFTAYRPTRVAADALARAGTALEQGRPDLAEREFHAAIQADPHAPRPWQELALLYGHRWLLSGTAQDFAACQHAWREAVQRNPRAYGLWRTMGELYLEGYRRWPQPEVLAASLEAYQKAVERYPSHAGMRVELAWLLYLSGDHGGAAHQAEEALRRDRQNPHAEKKLSRFSAPLDSHASNLEHLAEKLRKLEEPNLQSP